jgi:FixJ family two-component response regulator
MVAVVEDDPSMLRALELLLSVSGYHVTGFASAEEFLARPPMPAVACAVLDVHLNGTTGVALHAVLRRRGIDLPVVFMTGCDDPSTHTLLREAGVTSFLRKPFDEALLLAAIEHALANGHREPRASGQ